MKIAVKERGINNKSPIYLNVKLIYKTFCLFLRAGFIIFVEYFFCKKNFFIKNE